MENKKMEYLVELIISRIQGDYRFYNMENDIHNFLNKGLNKEKQEEALVQLYLLQLYRNAYISADPRCKERLLLKAKSILRVNSEAELDEKIKQIKDLVEEMQSAETDIMKTIDKIIEDKEKNKGYIF